MQHLVFSCHGALIHFCSKDFSSLYVLYNKACLVKQVFYKNLNLYIFCVTYVQTIPYYLCQFKIHSGSFLANLIIQRSNNKIQREWAGAQSIDTNEVAKKAYIPLDWTIRQYVLKTGLNRRAWLLNTINYLNLRKASNINHLYDLLPKCY